MHQAKLDAISGQCAEQYRTLLTAIVGHFAKALDSTDPTSPKVRTQFRRSLEQLSRAFLAGMVEQVKAHTRELRDDALKTASRPLSDPELRDLDEHLQDALDDLQDALRACLARDCRAAEHELRKFAHMVNLTQSSSGMSRIGAIIKVKYGRVSDFSFSQADRIGRKRVSDAFVRALIRHHLVITCVETQMFAIAKLGFDLARVGDTNLIISITGTTPGYESYDDVRDDLFHPNSSATVVRPYSSAIAHKE